MPNPFAPVLSLTEEGRKRLETLIRAGSTAQAFAFRARVVLRAADPDCPPNRQIAAELDGNRRTMNISGGW